MDEKRYVVKEQSLKNLADVVREKTGTTTSYDIDEMVSAVDGFGLPELEELNVTENGEYTPTKYGYNRVTVNVQPPREEINITENGEYTPTSYGYSKVSVNVQPTLEELTVTENGIYTPTEYGYSKVTVNCPAPPPEAAYKITGSCKNKFSFDGWNWFLNNYGDKITTDNITDAAEMFRFNPIERIPIEINLADSCTSTQYIFSSCTNLVELPVVNNFVNSSSICYDCFNLTSLNGNKFRTPVAAVAADNLFNGCYKLRTVDGFFDNVPDENAGASIFGLYRTFLNCHSLDEVLNLPYIYSTYNSNYFFDSMVSGCYRLKRLTFRNQVVTKSTKSATLDLTGIGYAASTSGPDANTMYNRTDFTDETRVTDDASYQALKDNPDYWTTDMAYSRYNHGSAVETINSLPDITATGVTNVIKFKGTAGSNTDGGAINTLTAEEIAVATAKGWTVTLV